MIIALHISIALNLITIGLFIWLKNDQKMSNDLHEAELHHTHQGMKALMDDFNNYQIETERKIAALEKDLHETQLDYSYLSSPKFLSIKIKNLAFIEYLPMDFSRIYLNYSDFNNAEKKITILKYNNEKKNQKK